MLKSTLKRNEIDPNTWRVEAHSHTDWRPITGKGTRLLGKGTKLLGKSTRLFGKGTRLLGKGTRLLGKGTRLLEKALCCWKQHISNRGKKGRDKEDERH